MSFPRFAPHLRDLVHDTDVLISDIWGVVHNGVVAFPEACEALQTFRKQGGIVVMLTNSPRPTPAVQEQLRDLRVPDDCYDDIVTSGDLSRQYIAARPGQPLYQIGPDRDGPTFHGLDVNFAPLERADYIVCTGLFDDETETAEDYREVLLKALSRKLPMICANPDIIVERGHKMIYCAGAIAELYRELGGDVTFYGKPHLPAYQRAFELAAARRGAAVPRERMLAIGDSVRTDLAGANNSGIACVFVTRGIHSADFASLEELDAATSKQLFGDTQLPSVLMRELRW
ncbi:putative hydrolase YutF [Afipia felis]|uniref:Hydrolase YutF n=1 Tax=Afipia felis TaxID=1035 RepID=A0A090MPQ8_AFIFE|nr:MULTISPECIES: TIGR01459 family HAD-type hydrolase [Afipia]EFI51182.1 HAD-superfamily hydrolase, subfamily IIA [Afipia sp. 1NLS2]CEG09331.1 putative hydrolase YutF [Afipia felis]